MRKTTIAKVLLALMGSAMCVVAQTDTGEASLKIVHESVIGALKAGNPALLRPLIHAQGLGFYRESQMLVQLSHSFTATDALPAVLADLGQFIALPYSTTYRVVGGTGVVCMTAALQPKKGSRQQGKFTRSTYVYALTDGHWRLLSWHSSEVPLKR